MSLRHIATALAVFTAAPAFAATQGTLGLTSTGSVNISITKAVQAQILNNQLFGPFGVDISNLASAMDRGTVAKVRAHSLHKKQ